MSRIEALESPLEPVDTSVTIPKIYRPKWKPPRRGIEAPIKPVVDPPPYRIIPGSPRRFIRRRAA